MIVGLTGGIGSGKSTVGELFRLLGCAVFNSDEAAKAIYHDAKVKKKVIALLGEDCYFDDGTINKPYISSRVFNDTLLLHALNNIIHPAVKEKMKEFVNKHAGKIVVKESALLFEANLQKEVDKVIVVAANEELRVHRVMKRDGLTREEVLLRVKKQLPQEEKIAHADFVVYNNDEELVIPQVLKIFENLKLDL